MTAHAIALASAQVARLGQPRHGIVTAVNPVSHSVRVRIDPEGQETGWIPDAVLAAGDLRIACPCEIGTSVLLSPAAGDSENPVIVARLLDVQVTPPISPQTGQRAQPGELLVMAGQGAAPVQDGTAVGAATPGAGWLHITKEGVHAGAGTAVLAITNTAITLTIGGATFAFTVASLAAMGASITTDQDVMASGISLHTHEHTGVRAGTDLTGKPV